MINYLKNNEINREQWDNCIKNSPGFKPYAYSWYLDIMAPGWEALIDDDYDSVFPIPANKKFGIQYIATPVFLQQLGVFSPDKPESQAIKEFLSFLPDFFRLIDLCVGHRADFDGFKVTEKSNFELNLSAPYETLQAGFTSDCRRIIGQEAKRKIALTEKVSPEELITLFTDNKGKELKGIKPRDYTRLMNLMNYCISNKKGKIIGVRTSGKKLVFGMFLVQIRGSVTILFIANTIQSREMRAGYFAINELIKENSSQTTILDFAGSSIPSIAKFISSFGAENVPYFRLYRNRLLWPVRILK